MARNSINRQYFKWICNIISDDKNHCCNDFISLLEILNDIPFQVSIPQDMNRVEDGISLRYKFGFALSYPQAIIAELLDCKDASVLEVLAALAVRCEEHIMCDPDIGDRTGMWFWNMIDNLGLGSMTNNKIDIDYVHKVIIRLFNHDYSPNGDGGLFTVLDCPIDLRNEEIWYQMCWYLKSVI